MPRCFLGKTSLLLWLVFFSHSLLANVPEGKNPSKHVYQREKDISGNLSIVGSDTLANLVSHWGRQFKAHYPGVNVQIQTTGSSASVPALIEATAQFGTMSRKMRKQEIESFKLRYGYLPTEIKIAMDGMAIFVHQDNPISDLSLAQLDALYSQTLYCGATTRIEKWGQLGLKGRWKKRDIQLFGRNSISGTYGYFKKDVLCEGDFRADFNALPGAASVVQSVSVSLNGIGFAGMGYHAAGTKMLPLNVEGAVIYPTRDNVISRKYPLSRYLYVYVNKRKNKPLSPKEAEFIKFILSPQGQARVASEGFAPLSQRLIKAQLTDLGLIYTQRK